VKRRVRPRLAVKIDARGGQTITASGRVLDDVRFDLERGMLVRDFGAPRPAPLGGQPDWVREVLAAGRGRTVPTPVTASVAVGPRRRPRAVVDVATGEVRRADGTLVRGARFDAARSCLVRTAQPGRAQDQDSAAVHLLRSLVDERAALERQVGTSNVANAANVERLAELEDRIEAGERDLRARIGELEGGKARLVGQVEALTALTVALEVGRLDDELTAALAADTARPDDGSIVQPPEAEDGEVVVELERDEQGRLWRSYRPAVDDGGHPIWIVCEIQRDAAGEVTGAVETRELRVEEES
jgi:hypothetical protein